MILESRMEDKAKSHEFEKKGSVEEGDVRESGGKDS